MVKPREILQCYRACLFEAANFLCKKGHTVLYNKGIRIESDDQQVVVRLQEPLHFKGWPYRSGSQKQIDILAEIEETIERESGMCLQSTLRINYFLQNGDNRIACEAIHYDFNSCVQDHHPVCHAQMSNDIMDNLPESFVKQNNISKCLLARRHQAMRIPTAFVNFAGLFAKLTADHLPADTVREFRKKCKNHIKRIPDHHCGDIFDVIFKGRTLRSYGWYKWPDE